MSGGQEYVSNGATESGGTILDRRLRAPVQRITETVSTTVGTGGNVLMSVNEDSTASATAWSSGGSLFVSADNGSAVELSGTVISGGQEFLSNGGTDQRRHDRRAAATCSSPVGASPAAPRSVPA